MHAWTHTGVVAQVVLETYGWGKGEAIVRRRPHRRHHHHHHHHHTQTHTRTHTQINVSVRARTRGAAAQAVLEAYGGVMAKLPPFLAEQRLESYVHLKTATNLDFVPGTIGLTLSNARDKHAVIRGRDVIVNDVGAVREYACMQVVI